MSKNPPAATEYLDPGTEAGKDRLDYLKNERDWELIDKTITQVGPDGRSQNVPVGDTTAPDARSGYGAALEAAATGNVPGTEAPKDFATHSKAETRVFEHMVEAYGADAKDDPESIPGNLRQNMANTVAAYPHDVHDVLGKNMDYSNPHNSTDPNDVSVKDKRLQQFLLGVSQDGGAFRTIHDSQAQVIAQDVAGLDRQDFAENSAEAKKWFGSPATSWAAWMKSVPRCWLVTGTARSTAIIGTRRTGIMRSEPRSPVSRTSVIPFSV